MIIIEVKKESTLENALKILKSKVQKTRLVQQLKDRKEYVKPSVSKRNTKLKAIYVQQIKNGLANLLCTKLGYDPIMKSRYSPEHPFFCHPRWQS